MPRKISPRSESKRPPAGREHESTRRRETDSGPQFVIERSSEFLREWWTGSRWTEDASKAQWYREQPDAPRVTSEEEATSVRYPEGTVAPG